MVCAHLQQGERADQQLGELAVQVVSILEKCGAMALVEVLPVALRLGLQQLCIVNRAVRVQSIGSQQLISAGLRTGEVVRASRGAAQLCLLSCLCTPWTTGKAFGLQQFSYIYIYIYKGGCAEGRAVVKPMLQEKLLGNIPAFSSGTKLVGTLKM